MFFDKVGGEARTYITIRDPAGCSLYLARGSDSAHLGPQGRKPRTKVLRGMMMKKEYDFSRAKRGPVVPVPPGKTRITIRLDNEILGWFKKQVHEAGGGNYQTLINAALREYISARTEPLEMIIRRVIREELKRAS